MSIALLCSTGTYSGPPLVLLSTSQSKPQEGMPFTLRCLTAPDPDADIAWLQGEPASGMFAGISVSESHEIVFDTFTSEDAGSYTCIVLDEGEIVAQDTIDLQISGLLLLKNDEAYRPQTYYQDLPTINASL